MTHALSAFRVLVAAFSTLVGTGACFSDPVDMTDCTPGTQGCACAEVDCEDGQTCENGMCVPTGTGSMTDASSGTTMTPVGTSTSTSTSTSSTSGAETTETAATTSDESSSSAAATSGEPTSSSTGGEDLCGNFVTDPNEECDGGNGCSEECMLEMHDCNPLNNVPCPDGQKCSWALLNPDPFTGYFTCSPIAKAPLGVGEGDCFDGSSSDDAACDFGLACYFNTFLDNCEDDGGCCTEYCDTQLGPEQCSVGGTECEPEMELAPGLMTLGVCR